MVPKYSEDKISSANSIYILKEFPSDYDEFFLANKDKLIDVINEFELTEEEVLLTFLHTFKLYKSKIFVKDVDLIEIASDILALTGGALFDIDNLLLTSEDCIA